MNSAWARLLGYLDSEFLGCSLPDLLHENNIENFCFNLAKEPE
jgi:hypothetical protein